MFENRIEKFQELEDEMIKKSEWKREWQILGDFFSRMFFFLDLHPFVFARVCLTPEKHMVGKSEKVRKREREREKRVEHNESGRCRRFFVVVVSPRCCYCCEKLPYWIEWRHSKASFIHFPLDNISNRHSTFTFSFSLHIFYFSLSFFLKTIVFESFIEHSIPRHNIPPSSLLLLYYNFLPAYSFSKIPTLTGMFRKKEKNGRKKNRKIGEEREKEKGIGKREVHCCSILTQIECRFLD